MDKKPEWLAVSFSQQQISIVASKLLVCLMMASVAFTFGLFAEKFFAFQTNLHLVIAVLCASAIAFFVHPLVKFSPLDDTNRIFYQLSELIVLSLVLRVTVYLQIGGARLAADFSNLAGAFLPTFFYPGFLFTWIVFLVIWFICLLYSANVDLIHNLEQSNDWENTGSFQNDLYETRHQMTDRVLVMGLMMVFIAILTNTDIQTNGLKYNVSLLDSPQVINILVYFVLSFILLSLTQLAALHTRWRIRRLQISPVLSKSWLRYALVFFLLLALISLMLPTDYTLGFLDALNLALSLVLSFLFNIISVIIILFAFLMSKLIGTSPMAAPLLPIATQAINPPPHLAQGTTLPWFEAVKSILFWAFLLAVIGAAVVQYIRQNRQQLDKVRQAKLLKPLVNMLTRFWQWMMGANRKVGESISRTVRKILLRQAGPIRPAGMAPVLNWRRLSPRQKVIQQYQSLAETGELYGLGRKVSTTPLRYAGYLINILPKEAHPEIKDLTEEFLEARYTEHPITRQSPARVRLYLKRILVIMGQRDKVKKKKD